MSHNESEWTKELEIRAAAAGQLFAEFVKTIATLRNPVRGCPWDLDQDHSSLRGYMLEEAYEAAEAMAGTDEAHVLEELGDVLLQVVLNAQLAADKRKGDIRDVLDSIQSKMLRRHPHVFGELAGQGMGRAEIKSNWDKIKAQEKSQSAKTGYFADCAKIAPALMQSYKIGKKAHSIKFDWDSPEAVLDQCKSELLELQLEIPGGNKERLYDEMGDVFFSLAQLSRHLGVNPEVAAQQGNIKFLKRFAAMEQLSQSRGLDVTKLNQGELEALWKEVKTRE